MNNKVNMILTYFAGRDISAHFCGRFRFARLYH